MSSIIRPQLSVINRNRGIALLMVLMIVMAITIISAGFIARTDLQLAGGANIDLRAQMDQLADSALEHARGLLLHPQDIDLGESTGWAWSAAGQQLVQGSSDSYDVAVTRDGSDPTDYCTYDIVCEAYKEAEVAGVATKVAATGFTAKLRLDPCLALWTYADSTLRSGLTVVGDVQCGGGLTNYGTIDGDVFASALAGPGTKSGRFSQEKVLDWPAVTFATFTSKYSTEDIESATLGNAAYGPCAPLCVFRRSGDLVLTGDVRIDGMLLVEGDLEIRGDGNTIKAGKNLPALHVTGSLVIGPTRDLRIEGLVLVDEEIRVSEAASGVQIVGGLFAGNKLTGTVADFSGHGHSGVIRGNPQWQSGRHGAALRLNGVTDFVDCGVSASFNLVDQITLACWVNTEDAGNGQDNPYVTKGDNTYGIRHNSANEIEFFVCDGSGVRKAAQTSVTDSFNGTWHHLAGTYNGSYLRLYVDGALADEEEHTGPIAFRGQNPLCIGGYVGQASPAYQGAIDDVRIYGGALPSEEIPHVMNDDPVPLDPVAYWALEGPGDVTIAAEPVRAAIVTWPDGPENAPEHWSPAAGAFFRSLKRQQP